MRPTLALLLALVPLVPVALAQDRQDEVGESAQIAIQKGLEYLAESQHPDGYWECDIGYKLNYSYQITKQDGRHVGVTSLACMALMSNGNLPGRGKYGRHVERGLAYVLSKVKDSGFITDEGSKGSRMYSHAFATLFLAEVYGMTHRLDVKVGLKRAVEGIIKWQNGQGGWRYLPLASDADLSVTVCQLQALRAARNVGIQVNTATIEKAIRYVVRCANPDGSFKYQDLALSRDSFALTGAGLTSLFSAGVYEDENRMLQEALRDEGRDLRRIVSRGLEYLQERRYTVQKRTYFYFYGHYYAAQAMFVAGGQYWDNWYPAIRDELVRLQRDDGTWDYQVGPAFSTAMACIILQIPYRYLPIFQR